MSNPNPTISLVVVVIFLSFFCSLAKGSIANISYGWDVEQKLDLYFPVGAPTEDTRVIITIHGGGWSSGTKESMNGYIYFLQQQLPGYYVANIQYRLGTPQSPGFPKQLQDIAFAMMYLNQAFAKNVTYGLLGASAGGHLSMLYDYAYDWLYGDFVKLVVDIVGPSNLTDPFYTGNSAFDAMISNLIGPCNYKSCPQQYAANSPALYVSNKSAPTIGFYGSNDPLVPANYQMTDLKIALTKAGVPNSFTVYEGGHGDWKWEDQMDMISKIACFVNTNWKK